MDWRLRVVLNLCDTITEFLNGHSDFFKHIGRGPKLDHKMNLIYDTLKTACATVRTELGKS